MFVNFCSIGSAGGSPYRKKLVIVIGLFLRFSTALHQRSQSLRSQPCTTRKYSATPVLEAQVVPLANGLDRQGYVQWIQLHQGVFALARLSAARRRGAPRSDQEMPQQTRGSRSSPAYQGMWLVTPTADPEGSPGSPVMLWLITFELGPARVLHSSQLRLNSRLLGPAFERKKLTVKTAFEDVGRRSTVGTEITSHSLERFGPGYV